MPNEPDTEKILSDTEKILAVIDELHTRTAALDERIALLVGEYTERLDILEESLAQIVVMLDEALPPGWGMTMGPARRQFAELAQTLREKLDAKEGTDAQA